MPLVLFLVGVLVGIPVAGTGLLVPFILFCITIGLTRQFFVLRRKVMHPSVGRFCHVCGADGFKNEPCDGGLHS